MNWYLLKVCEWSTRKNPFNIFIVGKIQAFDLRDAYGCASPVLINLNCFLPTLVVMERLIYKVDIENKIILQTPSWGMPPEQSSVL